MSSDQSEFHGVVNVMSGLGMPKKFMNAVSTNGLPSVNGNKSAKQVIVNPTTKVASFAGVNLASVKIPSIYLPSSYSKLIPKEPPKPTIAPQILKSSLPMARQKPQVAAKSFNGAFAANTTAARQMLPAPPANNQCLPKIIGKPSKPRRNGSAKSVTTAVNGYAAGRPSQSSLRPNIRTATTTTPFKSLNTKCSEHNEDGEFRNANIYETDLIGYLNDHPISDDEMDNEIVDVDMMTLSLAPFSDILGFDYGENAFDVMAAGIEAMIGPLD